MSPNSSTQQLLVDITQDHGLTQVVNEPTCLENVLDLFVTNFPTQIQDVTIIPGLSDHDVVMIRSKTKPPVYKQASRKVPMYNRANWQAVKEDIQHLEHHISNLMQIPNIRIWESFCNSIQSSIFRYIPHKTTRKYCSLPWISAHLRRQIKRRNKLYRQAKR